jgi:hypothetical protein
VARSHHPELSITTNVVIPPTPFTLTVTARDGDTGKVWPGLTMHLTARAEVFTTNAKGQVTISVPSTNLGTDAWTAEVYGPPNPNQPSTPISIAVAHFRIKYAISAAPAARSVPARTDVDVTGHLYPPAAQKTLHLQRLYGRTWRTVNDGADRSSGRFTLVATPPKGLSYYRVYAPGDAGSVGNTSATFTITGR